ncbi:folate family ECF transporter S component [Apilactobacillus timberlakei]|uniref:folate family ECF transporter S component n=1 Tax=Apilactobacillus timberlakei TaxID=2008380 RepID=UPI00112C566B|nr:folate family ECF transporter S component [Apilactobacillus timberlakei]TPR20151.1 folate family ECF transporter S component [Apilactobacillus timberlakei]TPR21869.1 folate family ECF transporter S component [Apilactobacillus timberlakei]TPR22270.1 folate family ECF transporter S component [Apilactobacillus timberlakei]
MSIKKKFLSLPKLKVSDLTIIAVMIALSFILNKVGIHTQYIVITPTFIVTVLLCYLYGPIWMSIILGITDILFTFIGGGGVYIPGFTISAMLTGFIYGTFLFKDHKFKALNLILAQIIISLFVHIFLNTLWLTLYNGIDWKIIIISRVIKELILVPIQLVVLAGIFHIPMVQKLIKDHWG